MVRARRDLRPADHLLRGRAPGARPPVGRRPRRPVSRGGREALHRGRARLQRGRRTGLPSFAQGAPRHARGAPEAADPREPRPDAARRPAGLLLQRRPRRARARLEAPRVAGGRRRPSARLDPGESRGDRPLPDPQGHPASRDSASPTARARDPPRNPPRRRDLPIPGARLGLRPSPASRRTLHLDGRGEAGVPEDRRRLFRLQTLDAEPLQPRGGLVRLRNPPDGPRQGRRPPARQEGLRRDAPRGPRALRVLRPPHRVAGVPDHAALHAPARRALRRRPLVLLRPGHPALALLGGRRGPHGLHRRGAVRSRADCPGPFRNRGRRPDGRGDRPRGGVQDHGPRPLRARRNRASRPSVHSRPWPRRLRSRRIPFRRRSARPGAAGGRGDDGPTAASPRLPRAEPPVLPPRPAVARRSAEAQDSFELGRRVPAGPPVGGPHALLPGREFRPVGRGRRLRPRGDRGPRLVDRSDPPPAGSSRSRR